jgi:hypothetical protein
MKMNRTADGLAADLAAAVSGTGAVASWIATANDVLQLVATGIAIVAGVYAVRWHRLRIKLAKEKSNGKPKDKGK